MKTVRRIRHQLSVVERICEKCFFVPGMDKKFSAIDIGPTGRTEAGAQFQCHQIVQYYRTGHISIPKMLKI